MNTELIKKIGTDFNNFCEGQPCDKCRYDNLPAQYHCTTAFVFEWLAEHGYLKERPEKATLSETETVADNSSAPTTLPKWCKVGQWIMNSEHGPLDKIVLGKIEATSATEDLGGDDIAIDWIISGDTVNYTYKLYWDNTLLKTYRPVRFRPYKYEEAKALFGKAMEYEVGQNNKHKCCAMITNVIEDGVDVCINCFSHEYWSNHNATIDGVPIGVPVIDEEAMKGGEE